MNCDVCGSIMDETRVGWRCGRHGMRMSVVEDRRMRERGYAALTASVCFALLAVMVVGALCARGCHAGPAVADSVCERCGGIIGAEDHGTCGATEVAACR